MTTTGNLILLPDGVLAHKCAVRQCDYYRHYLAYSKPGQLDLTHEQYHAAEGHCNDAHDRSDHWERHHRETCPVATQGGFCDHPNPHFAACVEWEKKVRA